MANYFMSSVTGLIAKLPNRNMDIDEENIHVIRSLVLYFAHDPEFEVLNPGMSLYKSILLCGNVGSGKTLVMQAFEYLKEVSQPFLNYGKSFRMVSCLDIAEEYENSGGDQVRKYARPRTGSFPSRQNDLCFDDLGKEKNAKHYGNNRSVMMNIIDQRNSLWKATGLLTHFTTNLDLDDIEKQYDHRTRTRIEEQSNIIVLGGTTDYTNRRTRYSKPQRDGKV